jgi:hypothetical protein
MKNPQRGPSSGTSSLVQDVRLRSGICRRSFHLQEPRATGTSNWGSLRTKDRAEAERLLQAMNEAHT